MYIEIQSSLWQEVDVSTKLNVRRFVSLTSVLLFAHQEVKSIQQESYKLAGDAAQADESSRMK